MKPFLYRFRNEEIERKKYSLNERDNTSDYVRRENLQKYRND